MFNERKMLEPIYYGFGICATIVATIIGTIASIVYLSKRLSEIWFTGQ